MERHVEHLTAKGLQRNTSPYPIVANPQLQHYLFPDRDTDTVSLITLLNRLLHLINITNILLHSTQNSFIFRLQLNFETCNCHINNALHTHTSYKFTVWCVGGGGGRGAQ
jgi:hypothetical protein